MVSTMNIADYGVFAVLALALEIVNYKSTNSLVSRPVIYQYIYQ